MSEELIQRGFLKKGIFVGEYEYFPTHSTTLKQYKHQKIIANKNYKKYETRKPDGLIVDRRNKSDIQVVTVIENKKPSEFQTDKQKKEAIEQCNDLCQVLEAKMGIITDGIVTYWINPLHSDIKNIYTDRTTGETRSYSFILSEDKQKIQNNFFIKDVSQPNYEKLDVRTRDTYDVIKKILAQTSNQNSIFEKTKEVDPLNLAKSVWQDIYVNTGKDPTKCLYNVVELFIFKFLSDLNVLKSPYDFYSLLNMYDQGKSNKDVLEFYARNSRQEIIKLFKKGKDGTTIINGTIFVNSDGEPVESQSNLFKNSIRKYSEFQSLRHVKKEFKTKLFETFLKQSQDKSRLGQFFTPRKVVKTIVDMSGVENLPKGSRVCDPFCGVGGFILESIQKPKLKRDFNPKGGEINTNITYNGFDKGTGDDDEERTVILAKANMLIY